jgi:hypothetical protein
LRTVCNLEHTINDYLHAKLGLLRLLKFSLHVDKLLVHQLNRYIDIPNLGPACCTRHVIDSLGTPLNCFRDVLIAKLVRVENGRDGAPSRTSVIPMHSLLKKHQNMPIQLGNCVPDSIGLEQLCAKLGLAESISDGYKGLTELEK